MQTSAEEISQINIYLDTCHFSTYATYFQVTAYSDLLIIPTYSPNTLWNCILYEIKNQKLSISGSWLLYTSEIFCQENCPNSVIQKEVNGESSINKPAKSLLHFSRMINTSEQCNSLWTKIVTPLISIARLAEANIHKRGNGLETGYIKLWVHTDNPLK